MKIIIIITIILAGLIVASCSSQTSRGSSDINLRTGTQGLSIDFLKGTPPQRVFEGSVFPVMISVKNTGAYSIEGNEAVISLGVEKDYTERVNILGGGNVAPIQGLETAASFGIDGKRQINPKGEEEVIVYNVVAGNIDPQSEAHPSTVLATLCYPYETILASTVCIDTDVNDLRPTSKVCRLKDLTFSSGQGAPVAVTKVEMRMLPTQVSEGSNPSKIKPQFLIFIENKGRGTVIRQEAVKDFCTKSDTSHKNLNIVYVNAYISGEELQCQLDVKPSEDELGHIKLKDKKDIIRCWLDEGIDASQDSYFSPLKIDLNYGYTQSISVNYFIERTEG